MTALTIESYGSDTVPFLHMALNRPGSLYTSQPPVSQNTPSLEHPLSEKKPPCYASANHVEKPHIMIRLTAPTELPASCQCQLPAVK